MTLSGNTKLIAITVHLPTDLVASLDNEVEQSRKRDPMRRVSRAEVVREMVARGLKDKTRAR